MTAKVRCAIYTRKSTEDGLEQEFNSLHAQREACAAFIKSQQGMGWLALATQYDDGGLSGGTIERPALKLLLADIAQRKVDLVVVYKVDRLTRSLADFAKIVEVFDSHGVSFVSVTQQFNTSTSMGRLTLNMLLSFAQFEREVTGERIRDKIAASKKKGMWMGGPLPLGYDVLDKKLVINPQEATTVRSLFRLYLQLGTVQKLRERAKKLGLVTKRRLRAGGQMTGGLPFTRGHLYQLLSNPLYIGEVAHGGASYPGQHEPIVERPTFEAVRQQLEGNAAGRRSGSNAKVPSLLTGLVFDESGDRLCPTHANKKGRRYRYYISKRLMHRADANESGWRLPARELEGAVTRTIGTFLQDEPRLIDALSLDATPHDMRKALDCAKFLASNLKHDHAEDRRSVIQRLIGRITLEGDVLRIELRRAALLELIQASADQTAASEDMIALTDVLLLRRRGVEAKLIIGASRDASAVPDERLVLALAQAHVWFDQLASGEVASVSQIAARERIDASDVGRSIQLAFLAPDVIEAILAGRQPVSLTAQRLKRIGGLPLDWDGQRRLLGFRA